MIDNIEELARFYLERGHLDDPGMAFLVIWQREGRTRSHEWALEFAREALRQAHLERAEAVPAIERAIARIGEFQ